MAKFQSLNNVCNGGHIHEVANADINTLNEVMRYETKAIIIVGNEQRALRNILNKLAHKKRGLRAQNLCKWSNTSSLWIIRKPESRRIYW